MALVAARLVLPASVWPISRGPVERGLPAADGRMAIRCDPLPVSSAGATGDRSTDDHDLPATYPRQRMVRQGKPWARSVARGVWIGLLDRDDCSLCGADDALSGRTMDGWIDSHCLSLGAGGVAARHRPISSPSDSGRRRTAAPDPKRSGDRGDRDEIGHMDALCGRAGNRRQHAGFCASPPRRAGRAKRCHADFHGRQSRGRHLPANACGSGANDSGAHRLFENLGKPPVRHSRRTDVGRAWIQRGDPGNPRTVRIRWNL